MRHLLVLALTLPVWAQPPGRGGVIEVIVTTLPNEATLDDADVEVQRLDSRRYGPPSDGAKCKTENGRCSFRVPPGNYLVRVSRRGYFDAVDPLSAQYTEQVTLHSLSPLRLQVPMVPGGSVSGTVFTEDDKPVANAFLRARLADTDPTRPPLRRWVNTGPKGEFLLNDLPPGRYGMFLVPPESVRFRGLQRSGVTGEYTGYAVQLFHPGMEESTWITPVEITPGLQLPHRTVVMRRMKVYSISGALIDSVTREPLLTGTVALRTADEYNAELFAPRRVRGDGSFEFHSLAPGDYHLLVYRRGLEIPWIVPFRVSPASQPDLLVQVPEWFPVEADVRFQARYNVRDRTRLRLEAEADAGALSVAVTDSGRLLMGRLPPGAYRLRIESDAGLFLSRASQHLTNALSEDVRIGEAPPLPLELTISSETGEIIGSLLDDQGEPLGSGWALLLPEDGKRRARGDLNRLVRIGSDGAFEIPAIQPGEYRLIGLPTRPAISSASMEFWEKYSRYGLKLPVQPRVRLPVGLPVAPR